MGRKPHYEPLDMYELDHQLNYRRSQSFFGGYKIISDQISPEALEVICGELASCLERKTPGAVVEFGCYVGTTSVFIRRILDNYGESASREFHVYDSFEGLPEKTAADTSPAGVDFKAGTLWASKKEFIRQFNKAGLRTPKIHKAWFKDLTSDDVPDKIAFAFLDGDFYESIRDSLALVLPRMQVGGTIIVDDYAREALPGAAKAVHEHFSTDAITVVHNLGVIHL